VIETIIALMNDLIDRERRCRPIGVSFIVGSQGLRNLGKPVFELFGWPRIESGHTADYTGFTLLNDQLGIADNKQRTANHREGQILQNRGQFGQKNLRMSRSWNGWVTRNDEDASKCKSLCKY
jgi:hypothetical protein